MLKQLVLKPVAAPEQLVFQSRQELQGLSLAPELGQPELALVQKLVLPPELVLLQLVQVLAQAPVFLPV